VDLKIRGIVLKKDFQVKAAKLAVALILSNLFFFMLFSGPEEVQAETKLSVGTVELQLKANLLTPFEAGKKILLIHRSSRSKAEGKMKADQDTEGRMTVEVLEADAELLLMQEEWEVTPYLKSLRFKTTAKGESYEIRY
jgi:hypothetical protein